MSLYETVVSAMGEVSAITQQQDGIRVRTHCLYPTGSFVQVFVRGGTDTFYVSDEGGAVRQIEEAGAELRNVDKLLNSVVRARGLGIRGGIISTEQCNRESLGVAIALVANTCRDVADWLFENIPVQRQRKFKAIVSEVLRSAYKVHAEVIVGESNKAHRFENIVALENDRRLIVDAVAHDPNSISGRVLANIDIRNRHYDDIEQRIVYDDSENWKAEDLNLLQVGAPIIAFSKASSVIGRLARVN